jgi:tRNA-modifying protein YgfZ
VRVTTAPDIPPDYAAAREKLAHRVRAAGILDVTGSDRESFLQGQLTQDRLGLAPGDSRVAAGLTPKGKLLFVARVLGLEDRIRLIVPDSLRQLVLEHLRKYAVFTKVAIEERTPDFVHVGVSGPEGTRLALPDWVDRLAPERGFSAELLVAGQRREELETLLRALGSSGISDETAEVLRVEAGRPRFGADMDSTNLPDEVGMDDAVSTTKGCYVGQEVVARLRTYGRVNRRLVSFRFPEGPIAAGDPLRLPDEEKPSNVEAGRVTSSVHSPRFGAIGLGYAFRDVAVGARLVSDKNPALSAIVEKLDTRIAS